MGGENQHLAPRAGTARRRGRGRRLLGATLALAAAAALGTASASASTQMVPVPGDINAGAIPGASAFGTTPPNTPETVAFVLTGQNLPQLAASVEQGLRSYLTVGQFAAAYGQSTSNIAALRAYLAHYGISTQLYPDNLDVVATGTAGEFDSALSETQYQYHVPGVPGHADQAPIPAQTIHGVTRSPELPATIAPYVLAILGLTNYAPYTSQAERVESTLSQPQAGNPSFCLALVGLPDACNTPTNFAENYGLSPLYARHAEGQGETLGIVTFASEDPGAPQYFWENIAHVPSSGRLTDDQIDGGSGAPSFAAGSNESDLDLEESGSIAPLADVIAYEAPNTDYGQDDAFFAAASQNTASTVSMSWGESETYYDASVADGTESSGFQAANDEVFLEMAAQGQSVFIASGDSGAYQASADLLTTNLSVSTPPDSPFVTAAGATTLPWRGELSDPTTGLSAPVSVSAQRAWGWDYLWQAAATTTEVPLATAAESLVVGGGGGFSQLEPEPSYQRGVPGTSSFTAVPYLTPTDYQPIDGLIEPMDWSFDPTPPLSGGSGSGRALPDLSTDGDPETGYLIWCPSCEAAGVAPTVLEGGWGGTSFVAPQLNGSAAVIDSLLGRRVGLWNPAIYAFATQRPSPFDPLDEPGPSNDNIYYTGTPGTLFNEATGLGTPNLSALASDFAAAG